MYKADDITEETEEIVLKRARDTVDRAKFCVQMAQLMHDQRLKFDRAAPGRGGQGGGAAKVARLGEEQDRNSPWPCKSSDWTWRSCDCSTAKTRRSSRSCWPTGRR